MVTLDAGWGALTHSVLKKAGLSNLLVVNERPPACPRTFSFTNDDAAWRDQIQEDLAAGLNVVVVTLSSERAYEVGEAGESAVGAERVVVHTSKTSDDVKRRLVDVDALWSQARLVVYSPTIAAGVDFSTRHFDRMYFYACAQSALPSTALQMLFRVRHLEDVRVRCCVAPTMRLSTEASRAPMTSREMVRWLRWMGSDLRGDTVCAEERLVSDDPCAPAPAHTPHPVAWLPPLSYWLLTMAFVEAERYNARAGFVHEFAHLAEAAGHHVTVERVRDTRRERPEPGADPAKTAQRMLAAVEAAPALTAEESEALRGRVLGNQASSEDKWRHYVEVYKAGWGVDRIDAAFLEANGTEPSSPKVKLLTRVLCPGLRRQPDADVSLTERANIFKLPRIEEVLEGLGLESAFDDETVIGDLMAAFDARLRGSEMFRKYERTARLFRHDASVTGEWDLKKVVKAVNMVLGAVGLGLVVHTSQRRQVNKQRTTVLTYRLDPEAVANMVELVKLRLRVVAAPALVENPHARARVEACTLPRYGHLVDADRSAYMFVDVSDDD